MLYLYHRVPKNMQGNVLYPLNLLKEKYPDIYAKEVSKYDNRKHLLEVKIPLLNCVWNDVLHFSAVHPSHIKEALIAGGKDADFTLSCYQVDPKMLSSENTVVYLYNQGSATNPSNKKVFIPYNPNDIGKFAVMPEGTKRYYKESITQGKKTLLFHLIPHILYRETLSIVGLPIITV